MKKRNLLFSLVFALGACSSDEGDNLPVESTDPTEQTDAPETDEPTDPEPGKPFSEGPYGVSFRDTVGDIEASTLGGGTFNLRELWTGDDSFIFLFFTDNPEQNPDLVSFL